MWRFVTDSDEPGWVTYFWPYESKLLQHREASLLDRHAHAATGADGDGNLVRAHGHVDRAQEELGVNRNETFRVKNTCVLCVLGANKIDMENIY